MFSLDRDDGRPKQGDIILYNGGYAMFYFRDSNNVEFVLGMTFRGIVALKADCGAKCRGVIRTGIVP